MSKQIIKKIALSIMVVVGVITLAACNKSSVNFGDVPDEKYFTVGDHTISTRDIYSSFRLDAQGSLRTWFEENLVESQLAKVDAVITSYTNGTAITDEDDLEIVKWLEQPAVNAMFGNEQEFTFAVADKMSGNNKTILAQTYVDSLSIIDRSLDLTGLRTALIKCLNDWLDQGKPGDDDDYRPFNLPKVVLTQYRLGAAQNLYAREKFAEEDFDDEDSTVYIKEDDIVNYYKSNKQGRYDVEAFYVSFLTTNEANAALRHFNLKSTSRGEWVKIPDIRYITDADFNHNNHEYVRKILDGLNITLAVVSSPGTKRVSESQYQLYYDKYSIAFSRTDGKADVPLTDDEVLASFVDIHNLLTGETLTPTTALQTYTYDDLSTFAGLRTHIYSTLVLPTTENPNNKRYSARVQALDSSNYLVYKHSDGSAAEKDILVKEKNDDDVEVDRFADTTIAQNLRTEARNDLIDSRFTNAYMNTKIGEIWEDHEVKIFDETIKIYFEHAYPEISSGKGKNKNGNVVAEFNGKAYLVTDLYTKLEKERGISTALDIAFTRLLNDKYRGEITNDMIKGYKDEYKSIISNFSANGLEGSGFPSSLGRKNFMLLAFGAETNDQALENIYITPKLRELYYDDLEAHYGKGIYDKFAELSALQFNNFKSVTTSHLLVYVDEDKDGQPDDPNDLFKDYSEAEKIAFRQDVVDLVKYIYNRLGDFYSRDSAFNTIIAEYDAVNRVAPVINPGDLDEGISKWDAIWRPFRQKGLYLKYESIPAILNTALFPTSANLDPVYTDRALDLYSLLNEYRNAEGNIPGNENIFPFQDGYNVIEGNATLVDTDLAKNVESSFGWHFINVGSVGSPISARYLVSDDDSDDPSYVSEYEDEFGNQLNAYNNVNTLTSAQIEIFIKESKSEYGVESLPGNVSSAISSYFTPIQTLYTGENMQRELLMRYVFDQFEGEFEVPALNGFANNLRAINRTQLETYNNTPGVERNSEWLALYENWWKIFEGPSIVADNLSVVVNTATPNFLDDVTATNQFGTDLTSSITVDSSDVKMNSIGIYNVTYKVTDSKGLTTTKTIQVKVTSGIDPDDDSTSQEVPVLEIVKITGQPINSITVAKDSSVADLIDVIKSRFTATDLNDGNLHSQVAIDLRYVDLGTPTVSGGYIVILTVVDSAGNLVTESIRVYVS